jgi:hypothetical protein
MVAHSGTSNRVVASADGISWNDYAAAADLNWSDVAWGAGIFVCVGASGTGNRVMTSINGTSWTSQTSASDKLWVTVSFGNNRFVATDQYNTLSGSESNNAMICLGSGTATYSMPFRGPSYKKFIVVLDAFTSAGGSDINFPVPFNATPCVYGDSAAVAVATVTNSKITLTSGPTVSGVVFVEGY